MILPREITEVAERLQVTKSTIDKDWALGHFVNCLYQEDELKNKLIFKGGTCLRKCYFEEYRFSEDLDFTVLEPHFDFSSELLSRVCQRVESISGIRTHIQELRPLSFNQRKTGFQADVKFWGADHSRNQAPSSPERWQTRIKIEIILFEEILFDPVERPLFHPYSDHPLLTVKPQCYTLNEVLAEKLRALIQRKYTAPRDYYDIWYLSQQVQDLNWSVITAAFHQKMAFKGLTFEGPRQLLNERHQKTLAVHWKQTLGHQLPAHRLPTLTAVMEHMDALFTRIF